MMLIQRKLHKGAIILFVSLMLVDFLIVGQWFGFEELAESIESTSADTETRDEVIRDTLVMIQDYSLAGTGNGTYYSVYPRYQGADVVGYYDHAHNDYLEFSVELGLIGFLPLALIVLISLYKSIGSMSKRRDQLARGVAFAATMGMISLLIHSAVDFNLKIPANALLFITILAFAQIAGTLPRERTAEGSRLKAES
jgi:O-antigen ligase